ncbi:hypothetical protein [cf. Phormidesmis sp. LEGE 11477]|uniref:hypothetical protein n=1 Tax=cf. Phormidesmis sp. LEGE 11477 TaxID=1828680 RepID=UPI00187FF87D|nr:hypothetical protein [cf. Phormidesmis sp. LEGE 11477]MBE9063278.1 hypothetical protein [cf. Phormidesmis sp. LEGE 11477]
MLKSSHLFAISLLLTLFSWTTFNRRAQAAETSGMGLSFELSPSQAKAKELSSRLPSSAVAAEESQKEVSVAKTSEESNNLSVPAVPIPLGSDTLAYHPEILPPISARSTQTETAKIRSAKSESAETEPSKNDPAKPELEPIADSKVNGIGLDFASDEVAIADQLPTASTAAISPSLASEAVRFDFLKPRIVDSNLENLSSSASPEIDRSKKTSLDQAELSFILNDTDSVLSASVMGTTFSDSTVSDGADEVANSQTTTAEAVSFDSFALDSWIFQDGSDSLVARTVGSAEGTRHWSGDRTSAYYGHVDPGNGVWNLGTFSYQHGANSPEEADRKQLQRLKRQGDQIEEQATQQGIQLSLEEKLNALDLANQAPLAALDRGGYIEKLAQARRLKMPREEAILWARTNAYRDPDTRTWNAPGLGNNVYSISRDQERRMVAISKALKAFGSNEQESDSLANLERISLADTNPSSAESIRSDGTDSLPTQSSAAQTFGSNAHSNRSDQAVSFALPVNGSSANDLLINEKSASTSSAAAAAEIVSSEAATSTAPSSRNHDLSAAGNPTNELMSVTQAEEERIRSDEQAEAAEVESTEPISAAADIFELRAEEKNAATDEASSLDGSQAVALTGEPDSAEAESSEVTLSEIESDEKTRQQRLKLLQDGALSHETADVEAREADAENAAVERTPIYRVEDRVLPQK